MLSHSSRPGLSTSCKCRLRGGAAAEGTGRTVATTATCQTLLRAGPCAGPVRDRGPVLATKSLQQPYEAEVFQLPLLYS